MLFPFGAKACQNCSTSPAAQLFGIVFGIMGKVPGRGAVSLRESVCGSDAAEANEGL